MFRFAIEKLFQYIDHPSLVLLFPSRTDSLTHPACQKTLYLAPAPAAAAGAAEAVAAAAGAAEGAGFS